MTARPTPQEGGGPSGDTAPNAPLVGCRLSTAARLTHSAIALAALIAALWNLLSDGVTSTLALTSIAAVFFGMNAATGSCPQGWFTRPGRRLTVLNTMGFPQLHQDLPRIRHPKR